MTVVAFALGEMLYAVYHSNSEITEDILADVIEFSIVYDPFRDESLIIIDLSLLPS